MSTSYKMSSEILFKEPSPDVLVNYFGNNPPPPSKKTFFPKRTHTQRQNCTSLAIEQQQTTSYYI